MGARRINGLKKKKRLAHRKSRLKAAQQAQGNVDAGAAARKR